MLEAPGIKEKFFIWFVRPFAPRSRFLSTDGFFSVSLPPEVCAKLAEAAGAPAYLDLDIISLEERR